MLYYFANAANAVNAVNAANMLIVTAYYFVVLPSQRIKYGNIYLSPLILSFSRRVFSHDFIVITQIFIIYEIDAEES